MNEYVPTIGLEIHAELKTKTKMFCRSKNDADETRPNVNVCPVCLAHPGTLPVINTEAVRHVLRVGAALRGTLADYTEFDRKNYFYPDLPKGYQLSQYEYPLVAGGELHGVSITRVHLEEDTASSMHDEGSGTTSIDYNRSGVPLMELVTEPVITSAREAGSFARELQLLLRYLDVSNANMEKGEMRVEANISVGRDGVLGTKVEIKNLNSFRAMERAVEYEIERQKKLLEKGETVIQETRGWDEGRQATFSQRVKEGSADYRYFPDPDLPSLELSEIKEFGLKVLRASLPELPSERRTRYESLGIKPDDAEAYVRDTRLGAFFEEVVQGYAKDATLLASNYIANDLVKIISSFAPPLPKATVGRSKAMKDRRDTEGRDAGTHHEIPISARHFREIIDMLVDREISSRGAKDILAICVESGMDPSVIAQEKGLKQIAGDSKALETAVDDVIAKNPKVVKDLKAGKAAALEFLVGQCMKALRGGADPMALRSLLNRKIGS